MTYNQFLSHIRKGDFSPLYLLVGQERFQRDEAVSLLVDAIVDPATKDFNLDVFYADEADPSDVINSASSFPMMAQRRVVILKDCEKLPESMTRELHPLVSNPVPSTSLIFVAERVDFRRKIFAELKKKALVVEFKPLYNEQVPSWIEQRVRDKGKRISPEAVRLLHASIGNDQGDLAGEIEKLSIFVDQRSDIEREDVEGVVGLSKANTIFELTDAIGERNTGRALFILDNMLERGEGGVGIVAMIARHLMIMFKAKKLRQSRVSHDKLSRELGVHPYFLRNYLSQAENFSEEELLGGLGLLLRADDSLKGGHKGRMVVELLVHRLCGLRSSDQESAKAAVVI